MQRYTDEQQAQIDNEAHAKRVGKMKEWMAKRPQVARFSAIPAPTFKAFAIERVASIYTAGAMLGGTVELVMMDLDAEGPVDHAELATWVSSAWPMVEAANPGRGDTLTKYQKLADRYNAGMVSLTDLEARHVAITYA